MKNKKQPNKNNNNLEKIISLIGIILCILLILNITNYTNSNLTQAFEISDSSVNNMYNEIANNLKIIGYEIDKISNEDGSYSISGKYKKNTLTSNVLIVVDKKGNIIENNISTNGNLTNSKISKYQDEKNTKEFLYYKILNDTLNVLNYKITINDFTKIVNDANNYYGNIHGIYKSEYNTYEIYKDKGYTNINIYKNTSE